MSTTALLEIGVEEMPARVAPCASRQMEILCAQFLRRERLGYAAVRAYVSPRRMAIVVYELSAKQQDVQVETRGPSVKVAFDQDGKPSKALLGFARSQSLAPEQLEVRDTDTGRYVFAVKAQQGEPTDVVLKRIWPELITSLEFGKPMRWGSGDFRFIRPIRWIVSLLDTEVVEFSIAGVKADRLSRGHRVLAPKPFEIACADEYVQALKSNSVLVDAEIRAQTVKQQVAEAASAAGGFVAEDASLLLEVANIVEWPTAFCGRFPEESLRLPRPVLATVMKHHQKYFPVEDEQGNLLPRFVGVRDGGADHLEQVTRGNERWLKSRLQDAEFFFDEDLKKSLESRLDDLKDIYFLRGLGSIHEKSMRLIELVLYVAENAGIAEHAQLVQRAALLCKADLATNLVRELPELQGTMGEVYALSSGENPSVARAISEHYLPRLVGDDTAKTHIGQVLAIADRLDTLAGAFLVGLVPTGSQDPFALRRAATGIIQSVWNARLLLDIQACIRYAVDCYKQFDQDTRDDATKHLGEFMRLRVTSMLSDLGMRYDVVDAVVSAGMNDLLDLLERGRAFQQFVSHEHFTEMMLGFKRAANLAQQGPTDVGVEPGLLREAAESRLYDAFLQTEQEAKRALSDRRYLEFFETMAQLKPRVDEFLDNVLVMALEPEIKRNRLALLRLVADLFGRAADLTRVAGG